jgi:hypothetical protein
MTQVVKINGQPYAEPGVMLSSASGSTIVPASQIIPTVEKMLNAYLELIGEKYRLKIGIEKVI